MPVDAELVTRLARELHESERLRTEREPLTVLHPDLTIEDAYRIQTEVIRLAHRRTIGIKAALTSRAKQRAMGVDRPGYGMLLDGMRIEGVLQRAELIHPRVEPEIALVFSRFRPSREFSAHDVARETIGIAPALEVIDSRYRAFRFGVADVYADNCSSARFAVGPCIPPAQLPDLRSRGVVLEKNGLVVHTGSGAAVLGDPYASAAFVINFALRNGVELPSDFVLLSGGITEAVAVEAGDTVRARISGMPPIALRIV